MFLTLLPWFFFSYRTQKHERKVLTVQNWTVNNSPYVRVDFSGGYFPDSFPTEWRRYKEDWHSLSYKSLMLDVKFKKHNGLYSPFPHNFLLSTVLHNFLLSILSCFLLFETWFHPTHSLLFLFLEVLILWHFGTQDFLSLINVLIQAMM